MTLAMRTVRLPIVSPLHRLVFRPSKTVRGTAGQPLSVVVANPITVPHGPQALFAFPVAALLVLCDGLIVSELGAALPASGGTYHFLREIFGRYRWGRLLPFLFIWQCLVSGSLELASGYIGGVLYLGFAFPMLPAAWGGWGGNILAAAAAVAVTLALCRPVRGAGWLSVVLCGGTLAALLSVIAVGLPHFDTAALAPAPGAFDLSWVWLFAFGGAMRVAVYDYFGYYNICHLGDEVADPGKTIPRAVIASVLIVTALYLAMNSTIISVVGWEGASEDWDLTFGPSRPSNSQSSAERLRRTHDGLRRRSSHQDCPLRASTTRNFRNREPNRQGILSLGRSA